MHKTVSFLANANEFIKAQQVIADMEKTRTVAAKENIKNGIVLLSKGFLFKARDSVSKSTNYAKQSIPFLVNYKSYLAEAYSLIVMNYNMMGQFDSCIQLGNKVILEIRNSKNINCELEVLTSVARSYDFIGDRKKAIQLSLEAIDLAKRNNKISRLPELYISLASIYKEEDINLAKKYALLAVNTIEKNRVWGNTVNACYLILGNVYYNLKMQDSAKYYYFCSVACRRTVVGVIKPAWHSQ